MTRVLDAITATAWAIVPEALAAIVDVARRVAADPDQIARAIHGRSANAVRDTDIMAAVKTQPLQNAFVTRLYEGVAIMPVMGPIFPYSNLMTLSGATALSELDRDLDTVLETASVKALLLRVDSPGGVVTGTAEFAARIKAMRSKMPVVAHINGTGASAAYWIAAAAREIAIERTSVAGSIGVASAVRVQEAPDAEGNRVIRVVSSNAPYKKTDDASDETIARVRAVLDAVEAEFIADVAALRGVSRDKVIADFGAGGLRVGADAVAKGMADRVEGFEAALKRLADEVAPAVQAGRGGARRAAIERDIEIRSRAV